MTSDLDNVRKLRTNTINQELADKAISLGCTKAKIILTKTISLGSWNKIQCQYGCSNYGKSFTCPPAAPSTDEMSRILLDYHKAILVQTEHANQIREIVVKLEEIFKSKGFYKAFALSAAPCDLCEACTLETGCKYPGKARPTLHGCGIDIAQTTNNNGWNPTKQSCLDSAPIGMVLIS